MSRTFIRVFTNKETLDAMIRLRKLGWTYNSLGIVFNVDHTSIYNACKLRGIQRPLTPISLEIQGILQLLVKPKPQPKQKTYADYLEEQRRRRFPKLYSQMTQV